MKTCLKSCFLMVALFYFTQVVGNIQSHQNQHKKEQKMYVDSKRLNFSEKGIFLRDDNNQWLQLNQIAHDSDGYYLAGFFDFLGDFLGKTYYIAECKNCGHRYENRAPVPCEECKLDKKFNITYLEHNGYWDRHG